MLLPSALPCEAARPSSKVIRPKLISYGSYEPTQSQQSTIQASCRALQAILGGSAITPQRAQPQHQPSPLRNALQSRQHNARVIKSSRLKPQPPRSANKRGREDFEQENEFDIHMDNTEETWQDGYSTPKRQRRIPLVMPLGLCAEDFAALEDERGNGRELDMPKSSPDGKNNSEWTTEDDRVLVETVLEKLKLSAWQWNDCARVLGKDKDSLGRRWKLLVGKGDVGLRRGRRIERTDLDIRSW